MLHKEESTVIVGVFDGWPLCADPLRLALSLYVRLSRVLRLFVALGKLTRELFELNVAFALCIKVVGQVLDLPVLQEGQTFDLLLELLARDVAVFVVIKLFEENSHFWVVLFGLDSLKTVQGSPFIVNIRLRCLFNMRGKCPNSPLEALLSLLWRFL